MNNQRTTVLDYGNSQVKMKQIRKSISNNGDSLLEVNLEYPETSLGTEKFANTFNDFYSSIANNYLSYCENRLTPKIKQLVKHKEIVKPFGEIMKYYVTYCGEKYLCIVTDINHFNGYFSDYTRFSCAWDIAKCRILPYTFFLDSAGLTVKEIRKRVREQINGDITSNNMQFGYTEDRVKKYASRVAPENFFLTDNGLAFWFPRGTLAPESEGFPTFVVKCDYIK